MTHCQMEVAMTPVIIRTNEREIPECGKCSTECGYERYKAIILTGKKGWDTDNDTGPSF